jgi:hypothetical protein
MRVSARHDIHLVEGRTQTFGKLLCIVVRPEMHEEETRLI